jgi:hypothetical protein
MSTRAIWWPSRFARSAMLWNRVRPIRRTVSTRFSGLRGVAGCDSDRHTGVAPDPTSDNAEHRAQQHGGRRHCRLPAVPQSGITTFAICPCVSPADSFFWRRCSSLAPATTPLPALLSNAENYSSSRTVPDATPSAKPVAAHMRRLRRSELCMKDTTSGISLKLLRKA